MKKINLILTTFFASSILTASQHIELGDGWLLGGDIRSGWVGYDYQNPPPGDANINRGHTDSKGIYLMPKISIITPIIAGFHAKITGAGATDFGINDPDYASRTFVFGSDAKPYAILQEAYLTYDKNKNHLLIGAEEFSTPMIDTDDWYMLANTFQLAYYTNTMLEYNKFTFGYFYKMAGVWDSGADGTNYHSMSDASFVSVKDKKNADDSGVIFGEYQFKNSSHNLQIWNYYATDLYNTLFIQYDYTNKTNFLNYDFGLQLINFKEVGALADNDYSEIDYSLYSVRFDGSFDMGIDFATGIAKYTDGKGQNETLGAWGGYPYFANGMIFHFFEAGSLQNTASYKAQIGYKFSDEHWLGFRHTYWDLDPKYSKSSQGKPQDEMIMYGIRYSYNSGSGAYFTGTYEYVDLDNEPSTFSLRLIGGYKF